MYSPSSSTSENLVSLSELHVAISDLRLASKCSHLQNTDRDIISLLSQLYLHPQPHTSSRVRAIMVQPKDGIPKPFSDSLQRYVSAISHISGTFDINNTISLFRSGDFSDLVVKCQSDTHNVHKVVLCAQSKFFKAACSNGFEASCKKVRKHSGTVSDFLRQKSTTGVIEFPEEDPKIVHSALKFLSGIEYAEQTISPFTLLVKLYQFADKYDIPALKHASCARYRFLTKGDFPTLLKDFLASVELIYASSFLGDRELRDIAAACAADNPDTISRNQRCMRVMRHVVDFALDVVMQQAKRLKDQPDVNQCPDCREVWTTVDDVSDGVSQHCLHCGYHHNLWSDFERGNFLTERHH